MRRPAALRMTKRARHASPLRQGASAACDYVGILGILGPTDWIIYNVLPDPAEISLIADDVFVKIALPEWRAFHPTLFVHALCRC